MSLHSDSEDRESILQRHEFEVIKMVIKMCCSLNRHEKEMFGLQVAHTSRSYHDPLFMLKVQDQYLFLQTYTIEGIICL